MFDWGIWIWQIDRCAFYPPAAALPPPASAHRRVLIWMARLCDGFKNPNGFSRVRGRCGGDFSGAHEFAQSTAVGKQIAEALMVHQRGLGRRARIERVRDLLAQVGMDDPRMPNSFPHQLSGAAAAGHDCHGSG